MRAAWLFFDMGSTVMNETPAMERRIRDSIAGTDITYEEIAAKMAELRAMGLREDVAAVKSPGMRTVLIRRGYGGRDIIHHEGEIPDVTVDSLPELLLLFPTLIS